MTSTYVLHLHNNNTYEVTQYIKRKDQTTYMRKIQNIQEAYLKAVELADRIATTPIVSSKYDHEKDRLFLNLASTRIVLDHYTEIKNQPLFDSLPNRLHANYLHSLEQRRQQQRKKKIRLRFISFALFGICMTTGITLINRKQTEQTAKIVGTLVHQFQQEEIDSFENTVIDQSSPQEVQIESSETEIPDQAEVINDQELNPIAEIASFFQMNEQEARAIIENNQDQLANYTNENYAYTRILAQYYWSHPEKAPAITATTAEEWDKAIVKVCLLYGIEDPELIATFIGIFRTESIGPLGSGTTLQKNCLLKNNPGNVLGYTFPTPEAGIDSMIRSVFNIATKMKKGYPYQKGDVNMVLYYDDSKTLAQNIDPIYCYEPTPGAVWHQQVDEYKNYYMETNYVEQLIQELSSDQHYTK